MAKKNKTKKSAVSSFTPSTPAQAPASTMSSGQAFNPDYSYVIKDLKRIGILAVAFFIILVAVSFVI